MLDFSALKNLAISDTGFVFDPRSGATFTLNPTGLLVLLALREGATPETIVGKLGERFDGSLEGAKEDVVDFVKALRLHGLVPPERSA
jgi:PqqD family protein of HPr-rel-A system